MHKRAVQRPHFGIVAIGHDGADGFCDLEETVNSKIIQSVLLSAFFLVASAGFISTSIQRAAADGTSVLVLASNGVKPALQALLPQVEQSIGHRIAMDFEPSKALEEKIEAGRAFDVAILASENINDLIEKGKIESGTRADLGRAGIGIGVRSGAPKPDIRTSEAMRQTLLGAKSLTFNLNGASAMHINEMLAHLGIADKVKGKLVLERDPGQPQRDVVDGKAELVITLIPEIVNFPGLEFVGPLPEDLQGYINFSAGVAVHSDNAASAKALIKFITSPSGAQTFRANGVSFP